MIMAEQLTGHITEHETLRPLLEEVLSVMSAGELKQKMENAFWSLIATHGRCEYKNDPNEMLVVTLRTLKLEIVKYNVEFVENRDFDMRIKLVPGNGCSYVYLLRNGKVEDTIIGNGQGLQYRSCPRYDIHKVYSSEARAGELEILTIDRVIEHLVSSVFA